MQTARTIQHTASMCPVHHRWGLDRDDRLVVERFRSTADREIKPVDNKREKGGREHRKIVSRRTVESLQPPRNEIIIATAMSRDAAMQVREGPAVSDSRPLSRPCRAPR